MRKHLILLALPFLMTACSVTEVRERAFIQSAGLYQQNGAETVILRPFDAEEAVSATGETLLTALESAEGLLGGELFLGHTELLSVGRIDLTACCAELLDGNRISPSCKLMYDASGTADPALIPILSQMTDTGRLITPSCGDALRHLLGRSQKTVLPALREDTLTLAVIDKDGNRLAYLNEDACRGLFWLTGEETELTLPLDPACGADDFEVTATRAELTAHPDDTGLNIAVHITLSGRLPKNGDTVAAAVKTQVKRLCAAAIRQTAVQCGADVIGVENAVLRADRSYYLAHESDWDSLLRSAVYEISVTVCDA